MHERCDICEMRNARKHEMRENAKCEKCDVRDMCESAKCAKMRKARNVETPKRENRENTKIAKIVKVVVLQQVQYKVLLYGLYAPVETWVSTTSKHESNNRLTSFDHDVRQLLNTIAHQDISLNEYVGCLVLNSSPT